MADRPRAGRSVGVTIAPGASPGKSIVLLVGAVALVCVALLVLFGRPPAPEPGAAGAPEPPPARTAAGSAREERAEPPAPAPGARVAAPAEEGRREAPPAAADAEDASAEGEAPLVPSGIGLFPPPGTDPIKVGIVVPDDFELPEGYLRHYQVTDDGQELPPILLFHPDYELLDDAGQPIPLPANRVVPPELAPPGLPIETLVLPEPREEDGP
jgi:hypothetical protein